ncbi:demethoxyubiquinone hydroxylase family protein [Endozoicomonas sp. SM1973]|uniref:Demethoxyubiquinone hydroxylase family protein n=1 Tax=Spartinivicinus marinus TaxID=2994442 RepID=A0A853I0F3_9GAMM|nr:demethoxyubiquinone hydroxylase family protein [Spartinivicinus marinus]MCX4029717.1 demethoxyubiquinone hydroxylase family protein [Spartinivicinus marinus]NYZ66903.1 demethoxyubiquinone hydroxylase family protein [Spartinivicinus marinus]
MNEVDKQLKIMHACEKGATGVYYGHRLVAWVFYRDIIPDLNEMHRHEVEHFHIFGDYISKRKSSSVFLPTLWCGAGIVYGIFIGLLGKNAIWVSTSTIESIVDEEMTEAIEILSEVSPELAVEVSRIQQEEREHQSLAARNATHDTAVARAVSRVSYFCSYAAKSLSVWV